MFVWCAEVDCLQWKTVDVDGLGVRRWGEDGLESWSGLLYFK